MAMLELAHGAGQGTWNHAPMCQLTTAQPHVPEASAICNNL